MKHEQFIEKKMDIVDKILNGLQSVICNIWSDDECTTDAYVLDCKPTVVYLLVRSYVLSAWWPYKKLTVTYIPSIIKG